MGHGIALTMARAGHEVIVQDPFPIALEQLGRRIEESLLAMGVAINDVPEIIKRIDNTLSLRDAADGVDIVIEAAPEKLELKREIFAEIEKHAPTNAILASNTSVIQITKIMDGLNNPNRALGTHWWNPPHMIPLVEVIKTEWTDEASANSMFELLENVGKTPVVVERDVPGFIGNRLQHALWREAISLVENGICDAEAVDTVVKSCFGRRLAILGPLENADLVGTDLTLDIHENVLFDLESRREPSPFLRNLVQEGRLGMKSGRGFKDWTKEEADAVRGRVATHLSRLEGILTD